MRISDDRRVQYKTYLDSPEWDEIRQKRLQYDGYRCVECKDDGSHSCLQAHHLTYQRIGHERLEDLVTLCHLCHSAHHGRPANAGPVAGPTVGQQTARIREQELHDVIRPMLLALADCERALKDLERVHGWRRLKDGRSIQNGVRMIRRGIQVTGQRVVKAELRW